MAVMSAAWIRIHGTKECNLQQAFELYLQEEEIHVLDAMDYDTRLENFKKAMQRKNQRHRGELRP